MNYQVSLEGLPAAAVFVIAMICLCVGIVVVGEGIVRLIRERLQ